MKYYRKNCLLVNENKYTKWLIDKYGCPEKYLFQRYKDIREIDAAYKKRKSVLRRHEIRILNRAFRTLHVISGEKGKSITAGIVYAQRKDAMNQGNRYPRAQCINNAGPQSVVHQES